MAAAEAGTAVASITCRARGSRDRCNDPVVKLNDDEFVAL